MSDSKRAAGQRRDATPAACHCGGLAPSLVSSTDRNRHTTDAVFDYFQCERCRLVFMNPVPADMSPFYAQGYQKIPKDLTELREIAALERFAFIPSFPTRPPAASAPT